MAATESAVRPLRQLMGELRHYRGVSQSFAPHAHATAVLGLVRQGRRKFVCNGRAFDLAQGDVLLLNPGDVHGCEGVGAALLAYDSVVVAQKNLDNLHFSQPVVRNAKLRDAFGQLWDCLWERGCHDEFHALEEFLVAVLCVGAASPRALTDVAPGQPSLFASPAPCAFSGRQVALDVRAHLQRHLQEPLDTAALARREGMSKYALIRTCKQQLALSPQQYLLSLRIEAATVLLAQGMPAAAVASSMGFSDQAHLTRKFKQRTGFTPARYQAMVRQGI